MKDLFQLVVSGWVSDTEGDVTGQPRHAGGTHEARGDYRIEAGIAAYERGDRGQAIRICDEILNDDPCCAWAWADPLYPTGMFASTGEAGFKLRRRLEIRELFANLDSFAIDVLRYADIALDVGAFGIAAEPYWSSLPFQVRSNGEKAVDGLVYCLEQLGVSDIKADFAGDPEERIRGAGRAARRRLEVGVAYKMIDGVQ